LILSINDICRIKGDRDRKGYFYFVRLAFTVHCFGSIMIGQ